MQLDKGHITSGLPEYPGTRYSSSLHSLASLDTERSFHLLAGQFDPSEEKETYKLRNSAAWCTIL